MKACDDCQHETPRRTKCNGCECYVCSDCYECHRAAQLNGEGCLFHMMAVKEKLVEAEHSEPAKEAGQ